MNRPRIYMDYHATTPVDPRVFKAMEPYFSELYGNPASKNHSFGREARDAVEKAREQIATLIGAKPREIIFTSGATESNNLALKGVARVPGRTSVSAQKHIVTVATEHRAVLDPCEVLAREGFEVTYLGVRADGLIDLAELAAAITDRTFLVSVMQANNEIGVIQKLEEIGAYCRDRGVVFHVDGAQAVGKIPVDVSAMGIDLLSISGHKLYAPKGIGALYVRSGQPRLTLQSQMDGGGHEQGLRSGTLPTPLIVALGVACDICQTEMDAEADTVGALRDQLLHGILEAVDGVQVNGSLEQRLPGNLNLCFGGIEAESLLQKVPDIALSTGSACTTANLQPSHVLKALGLGHEAALSSVRFGLGRYTTGEEIELVISQVVEGVKELREKSLLSNFS